MTLGYDYQIFPKKEKKERKMKREYEEPNIELTENIDVIMVSGDGYADDPWSSGEGDY